MKFSSSVVVASLASTSLAAHRGRHARFHAERDVDFELHTKRALEADPTLAKRCGEMINTTYPGSNTPMSFPNCFLACASAPECGSSGAAPSPAAPAAPASPAAADPAPAATTAAANNDVKVNANVAVPSAPAAKAQDSKPAAPASTPAASSSSSSSSSGSSSGGFAGLAYTTASDITGEWLNGKASWAYNWGYNSGGLNSKLEFVPMFHDNTQLSGFKSAGFSGNGPLLSLNEPDKLTSEGGCQMSPADACTAHKNAFSGYSGHSISSPAVSSQQGDDTKGLGWLKTFHSVCSDAKVDFVALHWYGAAGQSGEAQGKLFMDYVDQASQSVDAMWNGAPIWFTEVAAMPVTDAQVNADFLNYVMPKLEGGRVKRFAPFMVGNGGALGTSAPNVAGKVLIAA